MKPTTLKDAAVLLITELAKLLTDLRTWGAVGAFALTWRIFGTISSAPQLTGNQGFMFLAQAIVISAFATAVIGTLFTVVRPHPGDAPNPSTPPASQPPPPETGNGE